jgi:hypothetical protein
MRKVASVDELVLLNEQLVSHLAPFVFRVRFTLYSKQQKIVLECRSTFLSRAAGDDFLVNRLRFQAPLPPTTPVSPP